MSTTKKVIEKDIKKPYVVKQIEKWLQSADVSRKRPFKICVVAKTRKKLRQIMNNMDWTSYAYREGSEKRCGFVGFYYFKAVKEALNLRKKLYNCKDLYVFLQDDRNIMSSIGKCPLKNGQKRGVD